MDDVTESMKHGVAAQRAVDAELKKLKVTFVLELTNPQRMALADILAAYVMLRDQPQEFVDCSPPHTTTAGELLRLVAELNPEAGDAG